MTTKFLLIISVALFSFLTVIAGNFVVNGNIGATPEKVTLAYSAFTAAAVITMLSFSFAICSFKTKCKF